MQKKITCWKRIFYVGNVLQMQTWNNSPARTPDELTDEELFLDSMDCSALSFLVERFV